MKQEGACDCGPRGMQQGWDAVAEMVLPVAGAAAAGVGEAMEAVCERAQGGLPPLHLAVQSGSGSLVGVLAEWAGRGGCAWNPAAASPRGVTPLHLAALLPDGAAIASLLLGAAPPSGCFLLPLCTAGTRAQDEQSTAIARKTEQCRDDATCPVPSRLAMKNKDLKGRHFE